MNPLSHIFLQFRNFLCPQGLNIGKSLRTSILSVGMVAVALVPLPAVAMAQNSPPVANAGPNDSMFLGDSMRLQGSGTDPDGDPIVGYDWSILFSTRGKFTRIWTNHCV